MSQPNPSYQPFDYDSPSRDRKAPAPITNLPVNALSGETDPTRELRSLIEQLQQAARDSRAQVHVVEAERNDLAAQLDHARRQNEELRAHFVEITSIIRERDSALQEAERLGRGMLEAQTRLTTLQRELSETERQRDELTRTRDEAVRHKDELQRQMDGLTRASQDTNRRFNDLQRQLFSIRQARDTAQAQNTELTQRLVAAQDQLVDLKDQLEAAENAAAEAKAKAADPEELAAVRTERDEAQAKLDAANQELEQLRQQLTELSQQNVDATENANIHVTALADARDQISRLTQEVEYAKADIQAKERLIEEMRHNPDEGALAELAQARAEVATLKNERESVEMRAQLLTREVMDMRQQMQSRAEQLATVERAMEDTKGRLAEQQAKLIELEKERASALAAREDTAASLAAAQKQVDRIIRDRDLIRQQSAEMNATLEAQIEALRAQVAAYEAGDPESGMRTAEVRHLADRLAAIEEEKREIAERLDKQRSETIDLAAQLHSAQEQIRELSASLAEARLATLSAGRGAIQKRTSPASSPAATVRPTQPTEIFDASAAVAAMRQAYQAFSNNPKEMKQLGELANSAQLYSELAFTSGLVATHRVSAAFAGLAQDLYRYPEQVTPKIIRTLHQTIEFLATLPKLSNLPLAKDPATATIYAVDDDVENCECIRMAMETAMMRTVSVQDPAQALCELATTPCDLIFLDVSMPGMDGFELCAGIRNLALHTHTPVVFLTGLTTAENRVQSNLSGGNDFVGKPFLLCELTVKALMLMMKAQLHLA